MRFAASDSTKNFRLKKILGLRVLKNSGKNYTIEKQSTKKLEILAVTYTNTLRQIRQFSFPSLATQEFVF